MWKQLGLVVAVVCSLSVAYAAEKGTVKIVTEPGEAQITVNGERKGTSPTEVGQTFAIKLDQGDYTIEASKNGVSEKKKVFVAEDTLQTLTFNLAAQPEMVAIPAGTFIMGCVESRDVVEGMEGKCFDFEKPAHKVSVNAFQMGKTEVTFEQWDACEAAKACPHADDAGWGRGNRPVINVSWNDAQTYITWLNGKTGKHYRLPSEAEWEYAARGGGNAAYSWGNKASHEFANYGKEECCSGLVSGKDQWENTAPVGSFAANPYGLYDMHGNVWEWCQDKYHDTYQGAPTDGSAWESGDSPIRVLRGGSWSHLARCLRSANRFGITPDFRYFNGGFRLVLGQA